MNRVLTGILGVLLLDLMGPDFGPQMRRELRAETVTVGERGP
jgi:hypothetical protein